MYPTKGAKGQQPSFIADFQRWDSNHDGQVSREELAAAQYKNNTSTANQAGPTHFGARSMAAGVWSSGGKKADYMPPGGNRVKDPMAAAPKQSWVQTLRSGFKWKTKSVNERKTVVRRLPSQPNSDFGCCEVGEIYELVEKFHDGSAKCVLRNGKDLQARLLPLWVFG